MLAPLFHAWERYLASISKDRKVRPFEWGLDWLSPNGHDSSSPGEHVEKWVTTVMSDSRAFFDAPPTGDYDFRPASPDCASQARSLHPIRRTTSSMRDGSPRGRARGAVP
jgi:hypothetical protein